MQAGETKASQSVSLQEDYKEKAADWKVPKSFARICFLSSQMNANLAKQPFPQY